MSSAAVAGDYLRLMIAEEMTAWGDQKSALNRLAIRYRLPFWTANNIRTGRAKTIEADMFQRIRQAYLDVCERQIERLQHELAIEKAKGTDASLEGIAREAAALAARLAETRKG